MSDRRFTSRSGRTEVAAAAAADAIELLATCSVDSDSVYACSGSSARGSSCGSSLSTSDRFLHSAHSCSVGGRDGGGGLRGEHYQELCDEWARRLRLLAERHHHLGVYTEAESAQSTQTQSRWTSSSPLYGVSTLLAACSLSSLAVCIALTGFSLTRMGSSRAASGIAVSGLERNNDIANGHQIYGGEERLQLTSLTDHGSSHQSKSATQSEKTARYSWDCIAQTGSTTCRPVHKVRRLSEGILPRLQQHDRADEAFYVSLDGIYHVSVQMTGKVWLPPPTLLRVVMARVKSKFSSFNVTTAHTITGAAGSGISTPVMLRGAFSVYTAAVVRLGAGDKVLGHVVCVEDPDCIVHVNGTTSYLTLERLG